jgi:peptidyl-tRNA hydrolase ICT1
LSQLLPLVPAILHAGIRKSRYVAASSDSIVIQADESRKQAMNKDACYHRLNELITEIYRETVPGETSSEQKAKVKKLKTQYNESRLKEKKMRSSKKASRSRKFDD